MAPGPPCAGTPDVVPGRRRRAAALLAGSVLAGAVAWQGTQAAFVAGARNDGNVVTAGTLTLTDDAAALVLDTADLVPGSSESRCVRLTYAGSVRSSGVRLSSTVTEAVDAEGGRAVLQDHLRVVVEHGSATDTAGGSCGDFQSEGSVYAGSLAGLSAQHSDYDSGLPLGSGGQPWSPATGDVRAFRFTAQLPGDVPDATQGDAVRWRFTWQTHSA